MFNQDIDEQLAGVSGGFKGNAKDNIRLTFSESFGDKTPANRGELAKIDVLGKVGSNNFDQTSDILLVLKQSSYTPVVEMFNACVKEISDVCLFGLHR